jgi:hypothetical protein
LFHDSHLPLQKWFAAIALTCEGKKGVSANLMKRRLGVSYKTAWYMCHRIRKAMSEPEIEQLSPMPQMHLIVPKDGPGRFKKSVPLTVVKSKAERQLYQLRPISEGANL